MLLVNVASGLKDSHGSGSSTSSSASLGLWRRLLHFRRDMSGMRASLGAAAFYFVCSISMNFLNKSVVSSFNFNYPYFIMVCQMAITVVLLDLLRLTGYLSLQPYTLASGLSFLPASVCFALHSTLSLSALHGMNIPMYGAIKRCTPLVSLILSVTLLRKRRPSNSIVTSILLITLGCLVAGAGDLEFDPHAYLMGSFSVFAQAGYLTLVQRYSEERKSSGSGGSSALEMVYINSCNTFPLFLAASFLLGEVGAIARGPSNLAVPGFLPTFLTLEVSGLLLTYSQFLCAALCSALTASLVGVSKSILQTVIGFFTFGGVKFHPLNILGLALNTLGGCIYSYVKYNESKAKKLKASDDDDTGEGKLPLVNGPTNASSAELMAVRVDANGDKSNYHSS